jgi:hypothetical protein
MGEVFRAHDPVLNRDVAIKRIVAGLGADEMIRKRFQREAEAAARLNHPNIITVYELGIEGDQLFMAMEMLSGIDLKQALVSRKLSLDEKLAIVEQICEGLAFAHARGVVHRDLKPANIHLLPNGKVKIMDFGLARLSGSEMTSTGVVMGTPHYMSPEQVRGARADARSDIFALGCVLYEMLAGSKPFDAESMHAVLYKIMQEDPRPLTEAVPGTPSELSQAVARALAKNPEERFQDASQMVAAIRQSRPGGAAVKGRERTLAPMPRGAGVSDSGSRVARERSHPSAARSASAVPPAPAAAASRRWLAVAAGIVLVVVAVWAVWALAPRPPEPAASPANEISQLAQRAIDSQLELARRRLEAGELADAVRQAEGALKLDPRNAAAKQILADANAMLRRIDGAVAGIRAAGRDPERLAAAAFELMQLDPGHPDAEAAATEAGSRFEPRVEEARRLEQDARHSAEQRGAAQIPAFAEGADLEHQGQQALDASHTVLAARRFLEARRLFERAGHPSN